MQELDFWLLKLLIWQKFVLVHTCGGNRRLCGSDSCAFYDFTQQEIFFVFDGSCPGIHFFGFLANVKKKNQYDRVGLAREPADSWKSAAEAQ
jgi:hypothetical protein